MTSISSITKQYAGGLRQQQRPQKGGDGGVLSFLGIGAKPADENKEVKAPVDSESKDGDEAKLDTTDAAAEPSLMDKALNAVGFGNKAENEEPAAASEPAAAPAPEPEPAPEPTPEPAAADAVAPAPTMMERLTSVFKGSDSDSAAADSAAADSAVSSDEGSDEGSDAGSDAGSDEGSDEGSDADEDNGVDFEKFAEEIQTLRAKYQRLKDENKQLRSAKKDETAQNKKTNNSEFSKMIASLFAIKGSVAQLEYSLKKHAEQNDYPVEGLGLGVDEEEEEVKPEESGSESEEQPPNTPSENTEPASVEQIPEIPVNAPEEAPAAAAPEEPPAAAAPEEEPPAAAAPEEGPAAAAPEEAPPAAPEEPPAAAPEEPPAAAAPEEAPPAAAAPEEAPAAAAAPEEEPPAAAANPLFSGGKNHYVQNLKKNKTLRHHKRRNRHQTLRTAHK